jgi:hypothetical protein
VKLIRLMQKGDSVDVQSSGFVKQPVERGEVAQRSGDIWLSAWQSTALKDSRKHSNDVSSTVVR